MMMAPALSLRLICGPVTVKPERRGGGRAMSAGSRTSNGRLDGVDWQALPGTAGDHDNGWV
jgi:hypothetical protein